MDFYQDVLGFPLTDLFENRDCPGSTRFLFDVGSGKAIAFFDLPGLDLGPYAEVLCGLHHLAISIAAEQWAAARDRLDAAGVPYERKSGSSPYFRDPEGHAWSSSTTRWERGTAPRSSERLCAGPVSPTAERRGRAPTAPSDRSGRPTGPGHGRWWHGCAATP